MNKLTPDLYAEAFGIFNQYHNKKSNYPLKT